jgi:hypothetical protein
MDILMWAREVKCPWDSTVLSNAALEGHLDIIKWAVENDCPWSPKVFPNAALRGHFEILKWCHEKTGNYWDVRTIINAAQRGDLDIFKWLCQDSFPSFVTKDVYTRAAICGHIHIIKWLRKRRSGWENDHSITGDVSWDHSVCSSAASGGHLDVLKWAIKHNRENPGNFFLNLSSNNGNLEMIKWGESEGFLWNCFFCGNSSRRGYVDILKWSVDMGYDPEIIITDDAPLRGSFNTLIELRKLMVKKQQG